MQAPLIWDVWSQVLNHADCPFFLSFEPEEPAVEGQVIDRRSDRQESGGGGRLLD